jgi:hypothetical protein
VREERRARHRAVARTRQRFGRRGSFQIGLAAALVSALPCCRRFVHLRRAVITQGWRQPDFGSPAVRPDATLLWLARKRAVRPAESDG